MSTSKQLNRLIWGALVLFGVFQLASSKEYFALDADSALNAGLVEALIQHGEYAFNGAAHTYRLPGYPLLLSAFCSVFGFIPAVFYAVNAVLGTAALILSFELVRRLENQFIAVLSVLLLATSPLYFSYAAGRATSDLTFFFFASIALFAGSQLQHTSARLRRAAYTALAAAVFCCAMLRPSGIVFALAALAWFVFRQGGAVGEKAKPVPVLAASASAAAAGICLGWVLRNAWYSAPRWPGQFHYDYWHTFLLADVGLPEAGAVGPLGLLARLGSGLQHAAAHFSTLSLHLESCRALWFSPFVLLPLICMAAGMMLSYRAEKFPVTAVSGYLVLSALWPLQNEPGWLIAVYPLLVLYAVRGALFLAVLALRGGRRAAIVSLAASGICLSGTIVSATAADGSDAAAYLLFWGLMTAALGYWAYHKGRMPHVVYKLYDSIGAGSLPPSLGGIAAVLFMLVFGLGVSKQADIAAEFSAANTKKLPLVQAAQWLKDNSPANTVMMASAPAVLHRLSGHRVVEVPLLNDANQIVGVMTSLKTRYLVLGLENYRSYSPKLSEDQLYALLDARYPSLLSPVFQSEDAAVYRVNAVFSGG